MEYGSIERELYVDGPAPGGVRRAQPSPEHIRDWWARRGDFEAVPGRPGRARLRTDEGSGVRKSVPFTVRGGRSTAHASFRWTYEAG